MKCKQCTCLTEGKVQDKRKSRGITSCIKSPTSLTGAPHRPSTISSSPQRTSDAANASPTQTPSQPCQPYSTSCPQAWACAQTPCPWRIASYTLSPSPGPAPHDDDHDDDSHICLLHPHTHVDDAHARHADYNDSAETPSARIPAPDARR